MSPKGLELPDESEEGSYGTAPHEGYSIGAQVIQIWRYDVYISQLHV